VSCTINDGGDIYLSGGDCGKNILSKKTIQFSAWRFLRSRSWLVFFFCQGVTPASAQTIIDEWSKVQAPKPPELKAVTLDPKGTALLVLDFVKQTCNNERRPRCLTSLPQVQALLKLARDKGLLVVHSTTTAATPADILKDVAALEGEPMVNCRPTSFLGPTWKRS
jgi:hypothetical protein